MTTSYNTLATLAIKQSWREARAFTVLFFALLVAVASSSTVGFFAERLHLAMTSKASEFLGADLVVSGTADATEEQLSLAHSLGLTGTHTVEFSTMLASQEEMVLANIKAITADYPLKGELRSQNTLQASETTKHTLEAGHIWLEASLFDRLQLTPGDTVEVGATHLTASRILSYEPAQAGSGMGAFQPLALIHQDDLGATQAVQAGSRIFYRYLWLGDATAISKYQQQVAPLLLPQQRVQTLEDASPPLFQTLNKAQQYLNLTSLVAVLLASVGIALSATHFAQNRLQQAALLRCFGLSRRQTLSLFMLQLLLVGALAASLGAVIGWGAQKALFYMLADLLPQWIPEATLSTGLFSVGIGLLILFCFALPPLLALGRVPPMHVLRQEATPLPTQAWIIYALALLGLTLTMWQLSLNIGLTLLLLTGGLATAFLLGVAVYGLLALLNQRLSSHLSWRLSLGHLLQTPLLAISQLLAFALIMLAMSLVVLLRNELLENWQQQLPKDAPNHFAFNIMPHEQAGFAQQLNQISSNVSPYYPMAPGRLTHVNGIPIKTYLPDNSPAERTVQRDLNLTWTQTLPQGNQIISGQWWPSQSELAPISVEDKLAKRLQLTLGDKVTFNLGGRPLESQVANIRSVDWGLVQPNFFIIFAPGYLEALPHTWLASFYVNSGRTAELHALRQKYPAVSLLNVKTVLTQLQSIMAQVSLAIESLLIFVLIAGFMVLLAGIQTTLSSRIQQSALLRSLGTKRSFIQRLHVMEFASLGAASGILAWIATELTSFALYRWAFEIPWQPHPWLCLLPLAGALLICGVGMLGTRRVAVTSPIQILHHSN